jgi:hypothetical protein
MVVTCHPSHREGSVTVSIERKQLPTGPDVSYPHDPSFDLCLVNPTDERVPGERLDSITGLASARVEAIRLAEERRTEIVVWEMVRAGYIVRRGSTRDLAPWEARYGPDRVALSSEERLALLRAAEQEWSIQRVRKTIAIRHLLETLSFMAEAAELDDIAVEADRLAAIVAPIEAERKEALLAAGLASLRTDAA